MIARLLLMMSGLLAVTNACSQETFLQHIYGRKNVSPDGPWYYIIDPSETGYYDHRHTPYDQSASGTGGFFDDRQQKNKDELIEYNFDLSLSYYVHSMMKCRRNTGDQSAQC